MIKIVTFLLFFTFVKSKSFTNYCDLSSDHIACKNSGKFASTCPVDRKLTELSANDINNILNLHNSLRNKIAGGKFA